MKKYYIGDKPRKRFRIAKLLVVAGLLLGILVTAFYVYIRSEVTHRFASRRWSIPSRVFSATVPLYPGQTISLPQLKQVLEERRYQEGVREPLKPGEYKTSRDDLLVHLREFRFPGRTLDAARVRFEFVQDQLARIRGEQGDLAFLELEPLDIARLSGPERESRLLINIRQVPHHLINAVVAIEDHRFYEHRGVDWFGITRALWTDLRARRVLQGGSTITQQLVKNYFLEPERKLTRKLLEAAMAVVIESLYDKDEILEMYMNEIYMGQRGSVAVHGMGEAARYYFGRNVEDLTLAEAATLAGMIRGPNGTSPFVQPDAARERRNTVLKRMHHLGLLSAQDAQSALWEPLRLPGTFLPVHAARYFVDYVRQQLQELYAPEMLQSEGLSIHTTLHPEMALAAEAAVSEGLAELGKERPGAPAPSDDDPLQAALIAVQPKTGAVLALVGGRDYGESSFNRALYAHRQPGSAIKPFVYLSALERYTPVSWIADDPVTYTIGGIPWTPRNYDGRYHGRVMLRQALEESLNAATVNLAMEVGLEQIIGTIRSLGVQSPIQPVPSLALGAFEVTPLELAGAYAALDNDGQVPYLLSLKDVVTERGEVLEQRHVDFLTVTSPAKAYLITHLLEGAVEEGTARGLRQQGVNFPCAGKTGTSSDNRDSWFVGYTTDLLVVVWVGRDDNQATHLSGSQGAARIWARFVNSVRPWINPQPFRIPPGVVQRIICKDSGQLAASRCVTTRLEAFLSELAPKESCGIHVRP